MLLNNEWVKMRSKKKSKLLGTNTNEYITTPNLWDAANAVLRGKFIALQAYPKRIEKSRINNIT